LDEAGDMQPITTMTTGDGPGGWGEAAMHVRAAAAFGRMPPTALMLLAIVSVQLGSALATVLFSSLGPTGTAFATSLFSAAVLSLVRRRKAAGATLAHLRRHGGLILLFGLVDSAMVLPFFLALERIPLGIASTITFLGPLGLAVATSRRLVHFLWIAIALVGVALLTPEVVTGLGSAGAGLDPVGLLYAAIAALAWAAFVPMSKKVGAVFPGNDGLALGLWASAAILLPLALAGGGLFQAGFADLLGALPGALGVSLLGTVLPMALEFRALQHMSARTYGILVTLEPAVGAMVGMLCLGQPASPRMVIAVVCVMLAALGVTLSDRRE
jgi:inner membrane transporter RhtA